MDRKIATLIVAAADQIGGLEVEIYEGYSGRGMMGRETTGISVHNHNTLLQCVALAASQVEEDKDSEDRLTIDEFVEGLSDVRFDSLGRDMIVY